MAFLFTCAKLIFISIRFKVTYKHKRSIFKVSNRVVRQYFALTYCETISLLR